MKLSTRVASSAGKGIRLAGNARQPNANVVRAFSSAVAAHSNGNAGSSVTAKSQSQFSRNSLPRLPAQSRRTYASAAPAEKLGRTGLYNLHCAHGAKIVPFGGYEMPVQYKGLSLIESHNFTRTKASLFDVGHMVQHTFKGPGATAFLQRVTPADLENLKAHHNTLSTLLWPTGGIVDDTIITRMGPEEFYVVTNAGCREKDLAYFKEQLAAWTGASVQHEVLENYGLIALQGPLAQTLLTELLVDSAATDLSKLYFGQCVYANVKGAQERVLVSRGGYTGEDGFEISIHPADTESVTSTLLTTAGPERLQLAGLGARDSLRLEAGMCLYGHDLNDTTTPVEAGLSWVIGKNRRSPATDADKFHGADVILPQLTPKSKGGNGVERRRVGLIVEGAPAREGVEIYTADGSEKIGVITSGGPSPTLTKNIAMAYLKEGMHKAGTEVQALVRGRPRKAVVTKMPFVPAKYVKSPAA